MDGKILEETKLISDESIISLDIKSLYTNYLFHEVIYIAIRKLYEQIFKNFLQIHEQNAWKTIKKLWL